MCEFCEKTKAFLVRLEILNGTKFLEADVPKAKELVHDLMHKWNMLYSNVYSKAELPERLAEAEAVLEAVEALALRRQMN